MLEEMSHLVAGSLLVMDRYSSHGEASQAMDLPFLLILHRYQVQVKSSIELLNQVDNEAINLPC